MGDSEASRARAYGASSSVEPEQGVRDQLARWLSGVVDEFIQLSVPAAAALVLYVPPVLAVLAGGIAGVKCVLVAFQVGKGLKAGQYGAVFADLPALSSAAKIAFGSLSFLALVYALSVLITGLIGTRRQRLYAILGFILSIPALAAYTVAASLLTRMLGSITGWGGLPFIILFGYIGLDAAILGLLATDLRPAARVAAPPPRVPGDGQETTVTLSAVRVRRRVRGRITPGGIRFSRTIDSPGS